jgi:hypothetical protein
MNTNSLFKLFAKTEKITMEDSRKANGMLKYRLYDINSLPLAMLLFMMKSISEYVWKIFVNIHFGCM